MDFELPSDFMDVEDEKLMSEGRYRLVIAGADTEKTPGNAFVTKNGEPMVRCRVEFGDNPEGSSIFHYLIIPNEKSKPGTVRMTKRFLIAFGVDFADGISVDALLGCDAQIDVGIEHSDQYGDKNVIRLPKFD